jgi:hypothetical protein
MVSPIQGLGPSKALRNAIPLDSVRSMTDDPHEPDNGGSRRGAVIGLAVTVLLVVVAYYLMTALREQGRLEDCLMARRTNCAPIDTGR